MEDISRRSYSLLIKTIQFGLIIGFILSLGSICCFIAMNTVLGNSPAIIPTYWNRLFVTEITHILIVPGLWLVLSGIIFLSWKEYGVLNKWRNSIFQIFILLAFINGIFIITPLSDQVTTLAIQQMQKQVILPEYKVLKDKEDLFGIINFLILVCSLILIISKSFIIKLNLNNK